MSEWVLFYTHDPCCNFKQFLQWKEGLKKKDLQGREQFLALKPLPKICVSAALSNFEVMQLVSLLTICRLTTINMNQKHNIKVNWCVTNLNFLFYIALHVHIIVKKGWSSQKMTWIQWRGVSPCPRTRWHTHTRTQTHTHTHSDTDRYGRQSVLISVRARKFLSFPWEPTGRGLATKQRTLENNRKALVRNTLYLTPWTRHCRLHRNKGAWTE